MNGQKEEKKEKMWERMSRTDKPDSIHIEYIKQFDYSGQKKNLVSNSKDKMEKYRYADDIKLNEDFEE